MLLHGDDHALHRQAEFLRGGLDDADIGLVRHQPVDGRFFETIRGQRFIDDAAEHGHRHLEHFGARHVDHVAAGGVAGGNATGGAQQFDVGAIGMQVRGDDAGFFIGREQHGAGAIAEQDGRAAIVRISDLRERLGADHQRALRLAGPDEFVRHRQRIDETAAGRLAAERGHAAATEPRAGADDDQVDIFGVAAGGFERRAGGVLGHVYRGFAGRHDVAPFDAGALADPRIGGIHAPLEIEIRDHARGQVTTSARDSRVHGGGYPVAALAGSRAICFPRRRAFRSRACRDRNHRA